MIRLRKPILLAAIQISLISFGMTSQQQINKAVECYKVEGASYQRSNLKKPTPLHAFAYLGNLEIIQLLLKRRDVDVNALWVDQGKVRTALTVALRSGHVDCAKALLDQGAKLSVGDKYRVRIKTSETFRAIGQCGDKDLLKLAIKMLPWNKKNKRSYFIEALYGSYEKTHFEMTFFLNRKIGKLKKKEKRELARISYVFKNKGNIGRGIFQTAL